MLYEWNRPYNHLRPRGHPGNSTLRQPQGVHGPLDGEKRGQGFMSAM